MDSNASGFLSNPSSLGSVYYNAKEEDGIIDLGLSLRTLQPEAYHPPGHSMPLHNRMHTFSDFYVLCATSINLESRLALYICRSGMATVTCS